MISVSPTEILFCVRENHGAKIESARFTKAARDIVLTSFEAKGNNIYMFNKHDGYYFLYDDSNQLRRLTYDEPKRKFHLVDTHLIRSADEIGIRQVADY